MKNISNIVKKELDKIFHSPRLIFSTFILPSLLIFIIYSFMGMSATEQTNKNYEHCYQIYLCGEKTEILENYLTNISIDDNKKYQIEIKYLSDLTDSKDLLRGEYGDLVISYDENFERILLKEIEGNPNVVLYCYSKNNYSTYICTIIEQLFMELENTINANRKYEIGVNSITDFATNDEKSASYLAMMFPMLIMTFIFAGALSVGTDAIAGEKERGTISTMLMAPISKNEIILGKIIATIIITLISSICSFIGLVASLGQLGKVVGDSSQIMLSVNLNFIVGLKLLILIVLVSLIAVSLFLVASTYARSTKEATMYAMPVYMLGIVCGTLTMFDTTLPSNLLMYIIPIFNLTLGLKGVFMNSIGTIPFLMIVLSNVLYFILIIILVKKMFKSERIMFSK